MIEARIRKICATLASSLGEAGTEILARNIRACKNHLEYENAGRRVVAVFAHVRILGFSELADSLREQVIPLANAIGLQVHLAAALSGGSANRIVGGEFQLVWKFPDEVSEEDLARCASVGAPICGEDVSSVADSALLSLIKAIVVRSAALWLSAHAGACVRRSGGLVRRSCCCSLNSKTAEAVLARTSPCCPAERHQDDRAGGLPTPARG